MLCDAFITASSCLMAAPLVEDDVDDEAKIEVKADAEIAPPSGMTFFGL